MRRMGPAILIAHSVPGDELHDYCFGRAFELAGARPLVAWIGAASGDSHSWFERIAKVLRQRYAADVRMARTVGDFVFAETFQLIESASMIYIGGGDVAALAAPMREFGLDELIRRRRREGALVVGVSAGAIGLTRWWVEFPDDNPALSRPTRYACIGAVDCAVDCHDEDSDWEELRALLGAWGVEEPGAVVDAYGIPLGGALEVTAAKVTHLGPAPKRLRLDRGRIVE
jgi:cyanophycinase